MSKKRSPRSTGILSSGRARVVCDRSIYKPDTYPDAWNTLDGILQFIVTLACPSPLLSWVICPCFRANNRLGERLAHFVHRRISPQGCIHRICGL